jgi:excisionase family DNA binding protein
MALARSNTGPRGQPVKRLNTIGETAEILNVSTRTVRRLIDSGALRAHRVRERLPRITDEAIQELLAASSSE